MVVPAPPPYSPPRSNRASMIFADDPASGLSPASRSPANIHSSNSNGYRASPEPTSNPIFPPPPGGRNRSGSNDRPPALFNLSAFSRRTPPEALRLSPELNRDHAPPNTRRPVPIITDAPLPQVNNDQSQFVDARPPASRRAASTGAISSTSSQSQSRASSRSRWEPGMPLPPPPPGPPPPTSRSQSMTRTTDRVVSPPTRRPGVMSTLGPVPPTPAGWVDEDVTGRGRSPNRGLQIDTSSVGSSTIGDTSNSGSSSSGLARARHVRGEPQSIRERRAESKTRKSVDERSNNPWAESIVPSDIVTNPNTNGLARRPTVSKSTPRSARSLQVETPTPSASMHNTPVPNTGGSMPRGNTTPRPCLSPSRPDAPTPPFSPGQLKAAMGEAPSVMTPKALPTPPPQSRLALESPARPVSHILHIPNNDHVTIPTLVPAKTHSRQTSQTQIPQISETEQFARDTIERHQSFARKEAAAVNNEEKVRLFADFIVAESRIRRGRYSEAIDSMGSEILELTRDLFRPYSKARRASSTSRSGDVWAPGSAGPKASPDVHTHRGSIMAALHDGPQLQSNQEPTQGSTASSPAVRPDSTWWGGYMPSLSPIPSMVSEALSGSDSRGRPASRWWEVSQEGGSIGAPSNKLERSKRESKYMGMPRELREALQYENGDGGDLQNGQDAGMSSSNGERSYGPNEYPPEKTGWHDQDMASTPMQPTRSPAPFSPAPPFTPNPRHLDVSRLVTLPPPYPRHHPAVNNNHPDLTEIRVVVRTLSDFAEVEATKTRFEEGASNIREDLVVETAKRRNSLRASINRGIEAGSMSYADAAKMEADSVLFEEEKTKEAAKAEFDLFQHQVVGPLNDLLMDRLTQATEIFTQLRSKLFVDAQQESPNLTQEEGDEQPELLEKLTLLKWIFEAREQMHRELFDLLSDRNDRYRDMVIMPYRLAKNEDKVAGAKAFFAEDAGKRTLQFEQEILKRTEEFMDVIEENVVRGVEVQLSAFWDIAPSLSRITEKIPASLEGFQIQIPHDEYQENPGYWDYPMRYLYTLVGHCEKSTYQFIESQTNLLCLLHEVKSGVTIANCRLMRTQRVQQGEDREVVEMELKEVERDEEGRLTRDLKEKVRCVEELWTSALGEEMKNVKGRIVSFLLTQGAWEEDE